MISFPADFFGVKKVRLWIFLGKILRPILILAIFSFLNLKEKCDTILKKLSEGEFMIFFKSVVTFLVLSILVFIVCKFLIKNNDNVNNNDDVNNNEFLKKAINVLVVVFLGTLGIHKFIERKYGIGILYLCTLGIFGIGWLVDVVKSVRSLMDLEKNNVKSE